MAGRAKGGSHQAPPEAAAARTDSADAGVIRAVTRALRLLSLLNAHEAIALAELQQAADLPKTTVHRLLATLCQAGYVAADARPGCYRVTEKVRELGAGYSRRARVVDVGAPIAMQVTRRIQWPLAIGTLEGDVVVVRHSTMPYSPLAVQATTVGHRLGLLSSAMGMAYLAFCDAVQREALLQMLADATPGQAPLARGLWAALRVVQRRGYGLRLPARSGDSATVAVPILADADIVGVLSMTTFGKLMTHALLAQHVPVLRDTAARIGAGVLAAGSV